MQKRSMVRGLRVVLAAAALIAALAALYVQLLERTPRQEEDRLLASRLAGALEQARNRLKAELLAELRAELARGEAREPEGDQPLPDAVLRRSESGANRVLQQVLASEGAEEAARARFEERLDLLARRMDETDHLVRRDLEEIRAGIRREHDATGKVLSLLLASLLALALFLLTSLLAEGRETRREQG